MNKHISGFRQYIKALMDHLEKNDPDTKKKIDETLVKGGKEADALMDRLQYCYRVYLIIGFHKSVECVKHFLEWGQG
ncbi:MAG: hypothetical protein JHC26_10845 [Thermofilum sp.]|jgi:hypothetical protein|uniref:hypothetical protein n=1 Tax=Thermofilum sp. TaxID=1961369 RepID=UPI0025884195|nr:hypothetical protein [Thermofilum sp.]MCI4409579.1 hypothetical protein [Thermofilum sp.]